MSKNLTRKGFAFGALVALGASVFAGAPAYAADTIVLAADYSADTTLAVPVTESIRLNASLAPGSVATNVTQLRYKIVNNGVSGAKDVVATNQASATATVTVTDGSGYLAGNGNANAVNTVTVNLGNTPTSATATQTATITAFLDSNNNGLLEAGETQASQTVSFIKYSELTTTTTITAPTENDASATAVVKFNNVNNQALTAAKVGAYFTKGTDVAYTAGTGLTITSFTAATPATGQATLVATGSAFRAGDVVAVTGSTGVTGLNATYQVISATGTSFVVASSATGTLGGTPVVTRTTGLKAGVAYSTTSVGFKFVADTDTLVKAQSVKVQPYFNGTAVTAVASTNEVGTAQTALVVTRGLASFVGNTVLSTSAESDATNSDSETHDVALNLEKQVFFIAKDTATTVPAGGNPKAGQAVSVAVTTTGTALSATGGVSLTVNGTTYTSAAALPGATGVAKLALTTGSDGKVVITYKTTGFITGTVVFTATAENFTATVTGTETARAYTAVVEDYASEKAVTTDGVAANITVAVRDQFGGKPADDTYSVVATAVSSDQVTAANSTTAAGYNAKVVAGRATLAITDSGTGISTSTGNRYGLTVYTLVNGATTSPYAVGALTGAAITPAAWGAIGGSTPFDVKIVNAADTVSGDVTLTTNTSYSSTTGLYTVATVAGRDADNPAALTYSTFTSVDRRDIANVAPSVKNFAANADITGVQITGTVSSASTATYGGVAIPNAAVTISAAGMLFKVSQDGSDVYGADTLTFKANGSGSFTVDIWSHKAGKQTISIKAGTGTASLVAYFAAAAPVTAATVTAKVADGAAQFQSGRALDVVVSVADKFGNPVKLDNTYAAAGDAKIVVTQTGSGYLSSTAATTDATGAWSTKLITNSGDLGTSTITATVDFFTTTSTDLVATTSSEFGITDVTDISSAGKAIYVNTEFAKGKVVTVYIDGKRMPTKAAEATDNAVERKYTQKKAGKHTVTVRVSGGVVASETVVTTK